MRAKYSKDGQSVTVTMTAQQAHVLIWGGAVSIVELAEGDLRNALVMAEDALPGNVYKEIVAAIPGPTEAAAPSKDERGPDYEMFSKEGNDECERRVLEIVAQFESGYVSRDRIIAAIQRAREIIETRYPEIYDTEPAYEFVHQVNERVCKPKGIPIIDRFEV